MIKPIGSRGVARQEAIGLRTCQLYRALAIEQGRQFGMMRAQDDNQDDKTADVIETCRRNWEGALNRLEGCLRAMESDEKQSQVDGLGNKRQRSGPKGE
jgi:hypothetical protein